MNLKNILIATGAWTLFGLLLSIGIVTYIVKHPIPGVSSDVRAQNAGSATSIFLLIGYAAIWLPFAIKVGKKRREEMQDSKKGKKRRLAE